MDGNMMSLEEEANFAQICTQEEFNAYMRSLSPQQRNYVIRRAIKKGHELGYHDDAKSLYDTDFARRVLEQMAERR